MKHRFIRNIVFVMIVALVLGAGLCLGLPMYYQDCFPAYTWVNDIYCTGKSVTEVNEELLQEVKAPVLTIMDKNGKQAQIDMAEAAYNESYENGLAEYADGMDALSLSQALSKERTISLEPEISWNKEKVYELFCQLPQIAEELSTELSVEIVLKDGEYQLQDSLKQRLLPEQAFTYIQECIAQKKYVIDLAQGNCYVDYPLEEIASPETLKLWKKLDDFMTCGIIYDMGAEQITVDRKTAAGFISLDADGEFLFDENGELIPNEEAMTAFVEKIADEYTTVGTKLEFEATRGETVMVPYKKYGTELDKKAEVKYFLEAFKNDVSEVHVPKYKKEGYVRGKNDIGITYIEIDLTEQKMYAYVNGYCEVETDIVTGNMRRGHDTPEGVNYVYAKQKNRILRGADYESFVYYWMPVNGGIGIHDATWRNKFGGEIYKTNGSHGCINTPKDKMKTIYELYEVGTPVIMFY